MKEEEVVEEVTPEEVVPEVEEPAEEEQDEEQPEEATEEITEEYVLDQFKKFGQALQGINLFLEGLEERVRRIEHNLRLDFD